MNQSDGLMLLARRVTRLAEFSPIGQLFTVGICFENYRSGANLWATFVRGTSYVYVSANNWSGYSLGDYFTNSSGHPV
jgi:hypothetical protein